MPAVETCIQFRQCQMIMRLRACKGRPAHLSQVRVQLLLHRGNTPQGEHPRCLHPETEKTPNLNHRHGQSHVPALGPERAACSTTEIRGLEPWTHQASWRAMQPNSQHAGCVCRLTWLPCSLHGPGMSGIDRLQRRQGTLGTERACGDALCGSSSSSRKHAQAPAQRRSRKQGWQVTAGEDMLAHGDRRSGMRCSN